MHVDTVQSIEQNGFLSQHSSLGLACRTRGIDQQQGCCEINVRIAGCRFLRTIGGRSDISMSTDLTAGNASRQLLTNRPVITIADEYHDRHIS